MRRTDATIRRGIGTLLVTLAVSAALLAGGVSGASAAAVEETQTLVSGESDALCIAPVSGFPTTVGGAPNYAPLITPHSGPFPDSGSACGVPSPNHAVAVPAGTHLLSFLWTGSIPGASWVSINAAGVDLTQPPPVYYIYSTSFALCSDQVAGAQINVHMLADDDAGAFLNGVPIGHIPDLEPTGTENYAGAVGGWPATSAVGAPGGFVPGTNSLQFVVRDNLPVNTGLDFGATVTAHACEGAGSGPGSGAGPKGAGVAPGSGISAPPAATCLSERAFTIHIRKPAKLTYRKVTVKLNGHPIHVSRGRTFSAKIDLKGQPRGTYTLSITILTSKGSVIKITRIYHTCAPPGSGH